MLEAFVLAGLCCGLGSSCGQSDSVVDVLPPASLSELFGKDLYRADGSRVGIEALRDQAIIGIYFSAHWCPACTSFTPQLVSVANELKGAGKSFEVVMVSSGESSEHMFAYMREYDMPWLALPHGSDRADALVRRYNVRWIPTLVVIDGGASLISLSGREEVATKGARAYDDWLARSKAL